MPIAGAVPLTHLGVIRARGADATKFLQGQLTNDVAGLGPNEARLAGFCSAKGRLQASFVVWKAADDDVFLACAADLLAPTLKRLSMFVLRAQCKLNDASADVRLIGMVGAAADALIAGSKPWTLHDIDGGRVLRLPDAAGNARCVRVALSPDSSTDAHASEIPLDHWRWLEVQSGIPTIESATVDRFVPQMLNYELIGGVDFQKGCYPGQEVVARSQYRGTIKRRMFLFDADAPMRPGIEVFHPDDADQPAGLVVNGAPHPQQGWSALIEAKIAAVDSGTLHLGSIDGPALRPAELPYALT
ncbi:MAG: folate-binding protein [Caldimonas sp.]